MPPPSEFKFDCPTCGQHILVATEWSGRKINCPSCSTSITIPTSPLALKKSSPVLPITAKARPKPTGKLIEVQLPVKPVKKVVAQASAPISATKVLQNQKAGDAGPLSKLKLHSTSPPQPEMPRIAALTPAIKLQIVQAVQKRIANASSWLPGRVKGANAYAAKAGNGEPVLVDAKSPEATRFSLLGAFLLEYHLRRVTRTAAGRTKLLDQEIPEAVGEMLLDEMSEEEREQIEDPAAKTDVMNLSHAECLAVLKVLEERYSHRMEQVRIEKARRRLGNVRLPDLVKKLEKKARIAPEDVATALYHELVEVRRRLEILERRTSKES